MAVFDASIIIAAFSPDEIELRAVAVLAPLLGGGSHVPDLWPIEIANVLLTKTRRRLLAASEADEVWRTIRMIPVEFHAISIEQIETSIRPLAQQHGLSSYDASYLDLARRLGVPLATLDRKLRAAAEAENIPVL